MILAKVLEKKEVIRGFGVALVIAPFVNTIVKMALIKNLPNPWTWTIFWKTLQTGSLLNQILYVATVMIGVVMLQGKRSVWKLVLVLLGGYNLMMIMDFRSVNHTSMTWVFFVINIGAFLFVADQLVWKIQVPEKKANASAKPTLAPEAPLAAVPPTAPPKAWVDPDKTDLIVEPAKPAMQAAAPKPAQRTIPQVRKKILFQFDDNGPWGQLMGISSEGIHIRGLSEPPPGIGTREIEITLAEGVKLRTRLASRHEQDYFFDHKSLTSDEIKSLNKWLHSLSNAA